LKIAKDDDEDYDYKVSEGDSSNLRKGADLIDDFLDK